jgi:hypothetical protein
MVHDACNELINKLIALSSEQSEFLRRHGSPPSVFCDHSLDLSKVIWPTFSRRTGRKALRPFRNSHLLVPDKLHADWSVEESGCAGQSNKAY